MFHVTVYMPAPSVPSGAANGETCGGGMNGQFTIPKKSHTGRPVSTRDELVERGDSHLHLRAWKAAI
jgi:hypothetical protein